MNFGEPLFGLRDEDKLFHVLMCGVLIGPLLQTTFENLEIVTMQVQPSGRLSETLMPATLELHEQAPCAEPCRAGESAGCNSRAGNEQYQGKKLPQGQPSTTRSSGFASKGVYPHREEFFWISLLVPGLYQQANDLGSCCLYAGRAVRFATFGGSCSDGFWACKNLDHVSKGDLRWTTGQTTRQQLRLGFCIWDGFWLGLRLTFEKFCL